MKVSLVSMGKSKKRNVREIIISILSKEFPLNVRKIYNKVKKEYNLEVTYQAVFKLVKEMKEDGILVGNNKEYELNIEWIKQLEDELKVIKSKYITKERDSLEVRDNINKFVAEIGPKIKDYFGKDKACVIGLVGGGRFYAMAVWRYLVREGLDCKYVDYDFIKENSTKGIGIKKGDVESRKLIVVNSSIYSGKTYERVMEKLNKYKKKLKIKEIKWAVDRDVPGLADFSQSRE